MAWSGRTPSSPVSWATDSPISGRGVVKSLCKVSRLREPWSRLLKLDSQPDSRLAAVGGFRLKLRLPEYQFAGGVGVAQLIVALKVGAHVTFGSPSRVAVRLA